MDLFARRPFRPILPPVALLFVGRLHPTKAPDVAIDALAELGKQGIDAELTLAGAPVTEDYGRELRAHASNRGVEDRIRWLGYVDRRQLPDIYRAADIMVFLNRWPEPQGLTYMEAMACGIPVVAHPRGGARELLQQWPVAMMAEHCSGPSVAQSIRDLVADPELQRRQVAEAHRMLQESASLDHYVERLEAELRTAAELQS
jgi:glycosyltransferase involved in cell wall biosynthesis